MQLRRPSGLLALVVEPSDDGDGLDGGGDPLPGAGVAPWCPESAVPPTSTRSVSDTAAGGGAIRAIASAPKAMPPCVEEGALRRPTASRSRWSEPPCADRASLSSASFVEAATLRRFIERERRSPRSPAMLFRLTKPKTEPPCTDFGRSCESGEAGDVERVEAIELIEPTRDMSPTSEFDEELREVKGERREPRPRSAVQRKRGSDSVRSSPAQRLKARSSAGSNEMPRFALRKSWCDTTAILSSSRAPSSSISAAKRSSTDTRQPGPLVSHPSPSAAYWRASPGQPTSSSIAAPAAGCGQSHGIRPVSMMDGSSRKGAVLPKASMAVCIVRRSGETTTSCGGGEERALQMDRHCTWPAAVRTASAIRYPLLA
mmetsp:Transcript_48673/g.161228  ORF Transcript_48673/g.161228 Transcript_48673/m.161228 type:complete len:373 (-) Transcript_48673:97-1215(-)